MSASSPNPFESYVKLAYFEEENCPSSYNVSAFLSKLTGSDTLLTGSELVEAWFGIYLVFA